MSRTVATSTTMAGLTMATTASGCSRSYEESHGLPMLSSSTGNNDNDPHGNNGTVVTENGRFCIHIGRLTILVLGLIAIAFSVLTILSCAFFEHSSSMSSSSSDSLSSSLKMTTNVDSNIFGVGVSAIGLFSFETNVDINIDVDIDNDADRTEQPINVNGLGFDEIGLDDLTGSTCESYDGRFYRPAPWMDTVWTVAQFASVVAPSVGGTAILVVLTEAVVGPFWGSFLLPILLLIAACLIQGCTFLMLGQVDVCFANDTSASGSGSEEGGVLSSSSCRLSYGAFMSISASFLYYLLSVALCCLPRPQPAPCRKPRTTNHDKQNTTSNADDQDDPDTDDNGAVNNRSEGAEKGATAASSSSSDDDDDAGTDHDDDADIDVENPSSSPRLHRQQSTNNVHENSSTNRTTTTPTRPSSLSSSTYDDEHHAQRHSWQEVY